MNNKNIYIIMFVWVTKYLYLFKDVNIYKCVLYVNCNIKTRSPKMLLLTGVDCAFSSLFCC